MSTTPTRDDALVSFADGVWIGTEPVRILGMPLTPSMAVLRLGDGSLLLYSPVRLTPEHAQRRIFAHVMISADPKAAAHLVGELKKMPEVYKLAAISGTYDLMAEVGAESTERIDTILDAIGHLKGVQRTMSSIVLSVKFER